MKHPKTTKTTLLFIICLILVSCRAHHTMVTIEKRTGEKLQIKAEVASTQAQREQGLMFRKSLPEGEGMIFLFSEESHMPFWMKDTPIPLDLIFIHQGKITDIFENAVPNSETFLSPQEVYTMVLEVSGGYVARHGVRRGDMVYLP